MVYRLSLQAVNRQLLRTLLLILPCSHIGNYIGTGEEDELNTDATTYRASMKAQFTRMKWNVFCGRGKPMQEDGCQGCQGLLA